MLFLVIFFYQFVNAVYKNAKAKTGDDAVTDDLGYVCDSFKVFDNVCF